MDFLQAAKERADIRIPLSVEEFEAVKILFKLRCKGIEFKKARVRESTFKLGFDRGFPYNPIRGFIYENDVKQQLMVVVKKNGWCGQFAGKGQWESIGRAVSDGAIGIKTGVLMGRDIIMYAFEQTHEAV